VDLHMPASSCAAVLDYAAWTFKVPSLYVDGVLPFGRILATTERTMIKLRSQPGDA
jgi:hypothetical protein